MATEPIRNAAAGERLWFIVGRWQEYEGEGRANVLRLLGITAFYAVHFANYLSLEPRTASDRDFHLAVTFLTTAWCGLCGAVLYCRTHGVFPAWLKYLSTGCDLVLLTTVLTLADGPRSPLVVAYLLIIVLASLRFNLQLVWFATGGAMAGYIFLLGYARWGAVPGWPKPDMSLPRYAQTTFLVALALTGVVLGQVIRRVRQVATDYATRLERTRGG
ncbi:MAG TPA: hypothetical protein VE988_02440 [Gemmataceae bacterium]|nr:hypothetical protein [Gemmataceae bacterium]